MTPSFADWLQNLGRHVRLGTAVGLAELLLGVLKATRKAHVANLDQPAEWRVLVQDFVGPDASSD